MRYIQRTCKHPLPQPSILHKRDLAAAAQKHSSPKEKWKEKSISSIVPFWFQFPYPKYSYLSHAFGQREEKNLVSLPGVIFGLVVHIVFLTFIEDGLRWWYQTVAPGSCIAHGLSFTNMSLPTENNSLINDNTRLKKGWLMERRGASPPEIACNKYKTGGCSKTSQTNTDLPFFKNSYHSCRSSD